MVDGLYLLLLFLVEDQEVVANPDLEISEPQMLIFLDFSSKSLHRVRHIQLLLRELVVRLLRLQVKLIVAGQAHTLLELVEIVAFLLFVVLILSGACGFLTVISHEVLLRWG